MYEPYEGNVTKGDLEGLLRELRRMVASKATDSDLEALHIDVDQALLDYIGVEEVRDAHWKLASWFA